MSEYTYRLKNKINGLVYPAAAIGAADTLEQSLNWNKPHKDNFYDSPEGRRQSEEVDECWARNKGDGFWIDGLGRVMEGDVWEDLVTPFDKKGREIVVGDVIVYAMRDLTVSELKVEKIGNVVGCERTLHGIDLHTNKKTKNSYPSRCLKVSP
jgi:hypothetical protein